MRRDPYREHWVNNPPEWREFVFRYDHGELTKILSLASSVSSATASAETSESEGRQERSAKAGDNAHAGDQILKPEMRSCNQHRAVPVAHRQCGEAPLLDSVVLPSVISTSATRHKIEAACNHRPGIESLDREAPSLVTHLPLAGCASREMRSNDSTMSEDQTTVTGDAPCATSNLSNDTEAVMTDQSMTSNEEFAPTEAALTTEAIAISDAPTAMGTVSAPEAANTTTDPAKFSDEPYIWAQCTIQVSLQILPEDGPSSSDRKVILGVRTHEDAPLLALKRLSDLEPLPAPLTELLTQLAAQLPERAATERKRLAEEKTKAEEAKRREATVRAQAKRAATVVKTKTRSASSLKTLVHHAEPQTTPAPNAAITERARTTPLIEAAPSASTLQPEPPAPTSETPLERPITFEPSKSETSSGKIGDGQPSLF